jgi:hypothetical protein
VAARGARALASAKVWSIKAGLAPGLSCRQLVRQSSRAQTAQRAQFLAPQRMRAGGAVLRPAHMQAAGGKLDLRPLQITQLRRPQAVAVAEQYHGRVAMPPATPATTHGRYRLGSGTRTSSTRCATPSLRRIDLRTSGDNRRSRRAAGLANWATARPAPAVEPQALISRKSPRRFKPNFKPVSRPRGKHPAMFWRQAQHNGRLCGLPPNMPTKKVRGHTAGRSIRF